MSIITNSDFRTFTSVIDDNDTRITAVVSTAQKIVEDFLGYAIEEDTYTEEYFGNGTDTLVLPIKPISAISAFTINGTSISNTEYVLKDNFITMKDYTFQLTDVIAITYTAGYQSGSLSPITQTLDGSGLEYITLSTRPIVSITSFTRDSVSVPATDYYITDNKIYLNTGIFALTEEIVITYLGGYVTYVIPEPIKSCVCLIGNALLANFSSSGIAQNANYGNNGSVSYLDNTKYFRFFSMIDNYKVMRF